MLKFSNEVRVAILAFVALALGYWGFNFLKGRNLLTPSQVFYVKYPHVDQLRASAPVFLKGLQVGMVKDVYVDPQDDSTITVVLNIESRFDIPKTTQAFIISQSVMGVKCIDLIPGSSCEGGNCAQSGDYLQGRLKGTLESLIGQPKDIDKYTERIRAGLTIDMDSLAKANPESMAGTVQALDQTIRDLRDVMGNLKTMMSASSSSFVKTAKNAEAFSNVLSSNSDELSEMIANLKAVSKQLENAKLDSSSIAARKAIESVTTSLTDLRGTLSSTQRTINRVDTLAQGLIQGKGNAGKLLTDEQLYDHLNRLSYNLELISQDMRLHPDRYTKIKVKLFGKHKSKPYQYPTDDPAYKAYMDSTLNKKQ